MNPHGIFAILLSVSIPISVLVFIEDTKEIFDFILFLGVFGMVIVLILILTRRYWKNARRMA